MADNRIKWTFVERLFKCKIRNDIAGEHRFCAIGRHKFMTGPRDDFPVQLGCFATFLIMTIIWIVLSGVFVARTNPLLCLDPFLAIVPVSFGLVRGSPLGYYYAAC
jgi:hypothetical protein